MEKMTNVTAIEFVLANCEVPAEVEEKLIKIRDSFKKKSSGEKKPTPTQLENETFKTLILNFLKEGGQYTITDLMKGIPELDGLSNQRVSAIIRQMVLDKIVVREEIKRKAYFSAPVEE